MTAHQFAIAAGATRKWVQNASMILGRRFRYTADEAKWLGLIRTLNLGLKVPLHSASDLVMQMRRSRGATDVLPASDESSVARIVVDRDLYDSIATARLSRALLLEEPRTRGRRPAAATDRVKAAEEYGIDVSLLRDALGRSPGERLAALNENAVFLATMRSGRGAERTRQKKLP